MRKRWTKEEEDLLRERWPVEFATDLCDLFHCSSESVNHKAHSLGLVKDPSFDRYSRYGVYTRKGNHQ